MNSTSLEENVAGNSIGSISVSKQRLMRALKILVDILSGVLIVVMAVMVFSLLQSKRTGKPPTVFGRQAYIVLSGSMNPAFDAGSLILVRQTDPTVLKIGDVITYRDATGEGTTTHRIEQVIIDATGLRFITRGDANNTADPSPVFANQLIGQVTMAIPYAGFVMDFARTKRGLLFIVIIPGGIFIASELRKLYRYAVELDREEQAKQQAQQESGA